MRCFWCVSILLIASQASAIFIRADLEKVPVVRLAENLEKLVKDEPKKVQHPLNLARTYAMAYAKKTSEVEVEKRSPSIPWLGYAPSELPFAKAVAKTDDAEKKKEAMAHLQKAAEWYEAALKLDPENMTARIGLAWATQEMGKKDEAIKLFRKLVEDAWEKKDMKLQALGLTGETITTEGGGYLIALLDAEKDKEEIAKIQERIAKLRKLPRPITPIAIPLHDNLKAEDLEARDAQVTFDADGTGFVRKWSWITPKAAWLVHDPKAERKVTSGLQLFGNVTFRLFWDTGYDALRALDDNRDGELSGSELTGLALWHDANSNGIADEGEVKPLSSYEIVSLSCKHAPLKDHTERIAFSTTGVKYKNGTTRPSFDLILQGK